MQQQRLKKYSRDSKSQAAVASRRITDTSLKVIATIHDYKIIPASLLLRLVTGNKTNIHRHFQTLYHKGLVNRFAFMRGKNPGEFNYYLDNADALNLLVARGADATGLEFEEVRRNREKRYCDVNDPSVAEEMQGRLLFLKHEVMISRFHAMLELACTASNGRVQLAEFEQGPGLWNNIEVPKIVYRDGKWRESDETERLPHRPDAFFTLRFPQQTERESLSFFYEADRHRSNTNKFSKKLRAHFHFAVKQKARLRETYGLNRIRAVLTETVDTDWAMRLREAAGYPSVSGDKPSPLFWFTTSRYFTQPAKTDPGLPVYLADPSMIFRKIWGAPVNTNLNSLIDS